MATKKSTAKKTETNVVKLPTPPKAPKPRTSAEKKKRTFSDEHRAKIGAAIRAAAAKRRAEKGMGQPRAAAKIKTPAAAGDGLPRNVRKAMATGDTILKLTAGAETMFFALVRQGN